MSYQPTASQYRFPGGVHPPEHKTESNETPIRQLPLPPELIVSLLQHAGQPAECCITLGERVLKGQQIGRSVDFPSANVHAPTSGEITAVVEHPVAHPSGLAETCVVIKPDGKEEWHKFSPLRDPVTQDRQLLLDRLHDAGVVGLGGASFPSHVKLAADGIDTLLINAAECEPYITCDDRLMQERAEEILQGIAVLVHLLGVDKVLFGIEDNKPLAIDAMQAAAESILPSQRQPRFEFSIVVCPTKYPSGGEKQLIQLLTGKEVPSGKFPAELGLVMHNVATAYAVKRAVVDGEALVSRIVTLTGGALNKRGNVEALIGTPIDWLLEQAELQSNKAQRYVMGGPMMGFELPALHVPINKATNCLLVPAKCELKVEEPALPCIRCGLCADVCPASLLPQQLYWHSRAQDWERVEDYNLFDCIECGACSYVCPSNIPLVHYYRFAKSEIRTQKQERVKSDHARERFEFRQQRLEQEKAARAERQRKAAEARKKAAEQQGQNDDKKAAIAAAVARVKAKKAAQDGPASGSGSSNSSSENSP